MAPRRSRRKFTGGTTPDVPEKAVDATDEEQSSDDEAPEEVSAAAAIALAGRRRRAEQQARQAAAAPKRKRARTSSASVKARGKSGGDESDGERAAEVEAGAAAADELELPSDLLQRVKSGGLQRKKADDLEAREMEQQSRAAAAAAADGRQRARVKAGDLPRSDNFQLVVLDEGTGGAEGGGLADGKAHAAEGAKNFLRERLGSHKRVSHSLLKARKRLGPSPNF